MMVRGKRDDYVKKSKSIFWLEDKNMDHTVRRDGKVRE